MSLNVVTDSDSILDLAIILLVNFVTDTGFHI